MRAEELRRAAAAAKDGMVRARLHVQLAELLRARDVSQALAELRSAAADAPGLAGVTLAVLSLARTLPPQERLEMLVEMAPTAVGPVPAWAAAAAEAHLELGAPERAAEAWLALGRDERVPLHRRRIAARRAEAVSAGVAPEAQRAAMRLSASLTSGVSRLGHLRRALALAVPAAGADELVALATEWLEAGGPRHAVDAVLAAAQAKGGPLALDRAAAHSAPRVIRARTPFPPAHGNGAVPGRRSARVAGNAEAPAPLPARASSDERLDAAIADAKAGRANRARRLAEEALRAAPVSDALTGRAATLETALREGGYLKEALRVRRTYLEGVPEDARGPALAVLAEEAAQAGLVALARAWRADASRAPSASEPAPDAPAPTPSTPAEHYLHAQRLLAGLAPGDSVEPALAALEQAVAGHAGARAALALAESLLERVADGDELARRRLELLRAAHAAEFEPARRLRLAQRLADTLARLDDAVGAVAVIEQALEERAARRGGRAPARRSARASCARSVAGAISRRRSMGMRRRWAATTGCGPSPSARPCSKPRASSRRRWMCGSSLSRSFRPTSPSWAPRVGGSRARGGPSSRCAWPWPPSRASPTPRRS